MKGLRNKLSVNVEEIKQAEEIIHAQVAEILNDVAKRCDLIIKQAEEKANEIISGYGAKLIIKNNVQYNIIEKALKTNNTK